MINPQWFEVAMSRIKFQGPEDVQVIELFIYEPQHEKTYLLTFAPNEDSKTPMQSDQGIRCPHEET